MPIINSYSNSAKNMRYNAKNWCMAVFLHSNLLQVNCLRPGISYTANASAEVDAAQGNLGGTISLSTIIQLLVALICLSKHQMVKQSLFNLVQKLMVEWHYLIYG